MYVSDFVYESLEELKKNEVLCIYILCSDSKSIKYKTEDGFLRVAAVCKYRNKIFRDLFCPYK